MNAHPVQLERPIQIEAGHARLSGDLVVPGDCQTLVIFAHGSGSSRHSPRNRYVAQTLNACGLGTLLMDLLTADEDAEDEFSGRLRFDIGLLAGRLVAAVDWIQNQRELAGDRLGFFGASTGAAAALVAAAQLSDRVGAVVSRGGRPDLAGAALGRVRAPTLLIVGGNDPVVIQLNEQANQRLAAAHKELVIVPGAGHLFEEPGALEQVSRLAANWFVRYLKAADSSSGL